MKGDSLIIYLALSDLFEPPLSVDFVIQGIQSFSGEFRQVSYSHMRRQGNRSAHLLAKHAKGIVAFSTLMEENPCFLEQALHHDIMSFIT